MSLKIIHSYQTKVLFVDYVILWNKKRLIQILQCFVVLLIILAKYKNWNKMPFLINLTVKVIQVNLFQKLSFLNQLTHNMTRDCSLNSPKNTSSQHVVYKNCFFVFFLTFKTIFAHNMLRTCIFRGIQWTFSRHIVGQLIQEW